jgi:hypothetical protein
MARPSDYSIELASLICSRMAEGESVRSICRDPDMPAASTIFLWLARHSEFTEQYARAAEARAHGLAEEALEIADDGQNDTYEDDEGNKRTDQDVIARSRLRVDTRKWFAARLNPRKYGDKVEQTLVGDKEKPLEVRQIELVAVPVSKRDGGE